MLELTKLTKFTAEGDEEHLTKEAENFSTLYERREKIIEKIQALDKTLAKYKDLEDNKEAAEAGKALADKIKDTAKAIVELDKKNAEISKKLMDFLKGNIKTIRDGRGISNAYSDLQGSSSGYRFDSSK
jgi:seryl-tRNA synthetase